jgi:hypothetical protein
MVRIVPALVLIVASIAVGDKSGNVCKQATPYLIRCGNVMSSISDPRVTKTVRISVGEALKGITVPNSQRDLFQKGKKKALDLDQSKDITDRSLVDGRKRRASSMVI